MSYRFVDSFRAGPGWNWFCSVDDGHKNSPKHVEFHTKNKFVKLVHLVGVSYKETFRCIPHFLQFRCFAKENVKFLNKGSSRLNIHHSSER